MESIATVATESIRVGPVVVFVESLDEQPAANKSTDQLKPINEWMGFISIHD